MTDTDFDVSVLPITVVAADTLLPGFSPRLGGQDERIVSILAELDRPLPPIVVHRPTSQVIDGMHRLLAARRRGQETIAARFFDGSEASAFVLAVSSNSAHGLPLTLKDRKVAAWRILGTHGHWSDRRIAALTGLSDKTVAAIRVRGGSGGPPDEIPRLGLDGKSRRPGGRRAEVARELARDPGASLRQIAARVGVSPETVRAVKAAHAGTGSQGRAAPGASAAVAAAATLARPGPAPEPESDPRRRLQALAKDPALRSTDDGRLLLRLLVGTYSLLDQEADRLVDCVPGHELDNLRGLALAQADAWRVLARLAAARIDAVARPGG